MLPENVRRGESREFLRKPDIMKINYLGISDNVLIQLLRVNILAVAV